MTPLPAMAWSKCGCRLRSEPMRRYNASMTITFADPTALTHEQLEEGTAFAPRFDAAGLVTVVTTEAGTNEVLMLAHMNAEALSLTLETGIAHYWSRSRGKLWKKGETSGELQEVVELRTDCDQDAIVLVVNQTGRGAACHTGRKSMLLSPGFGDTGRSEPRRHRPAPPVRSPCRLRQLAAPLEQTNHEYAGEEPAQVGLPGNTDFSAGKQWQQRNRRVQHHPDQDEHARPVVPP
jgi:phosphoribosyl-AMP cyclohydrolase